MSGRAEIPSEAQKIDQFCSALGAQYFALNSDLPDFPYANDGI